uniref:Uncharacterized protein n=1 Tax=Arundo donax TaxID=35708 RepID=A0A0A9D3I0_ARUDO
MLSSSPGIKALHILKLSIRIIASKASRGRNTIFRSTDG